MLPSSASEYIWNEFMSSAPIFIDERYGGESDRSEEVEERPLELACGGVGPREGVGVAPLIAES